MSNPAIHTPATDPRWRDLRRLARMGRDTTAERNTETAARKAADAVLQANIDAHAAAPDPHPQYLRDEDRVAWVTEGFTPTVGQTQFTLSAIPTGESVQVIINGVVYVNGPDFTVLDDVVTWTGSLFTLDATDEVVIRYYVAAPAMAGGGSVYLPPGWI